MNKALFTLSSLLLLGTMASATDIYLSDATKVPDLSMKGSNLDFHLIEGYQNYRIVATHFRKDKHEIRYILANPVAYNALKAHMPVMPDGSKVVKIGWSTKEMNSFPAALEASAIQRVEYMVRDKNLHAESDGWGYARFVKKNGTYQAWEGDPKACVACHASVKQHDALFTQFQKMF
jgi:hypothetical protein